MGVARVGEGKEEKSLGRGRCCAQTSLHCSSAEEVSPSQALLSLQNNTPPSVREKVLAKDVFPGNLASA